MDSLSRSLAWLCGNRTFQEWIELGARIFDLLHREATAAIMVDRRKIRANLIQSLISVTYLPIDTYVLEI
jgi:hypothetical protein